MGTLTTLLRQQLAEMQRQDERMLREVDETINRAHRLITEMRQSELDIND